MTELVSVLTPVYPPTAEHLGAAYESLLKQSADMPSGWDWEWIIQEDGESGSVASMLPDDKRISHGTGRHGGAGIARNLGLARAQGSLIKVLDADDMLLPGALKRDIQVLETHPDVAWTTSRVLDLLPDGSTIGFEFDPPEGRLQGTSVLDHWRTHNYRASVHPATLCIRRSILLALGGWMGLPASEDTGLLISASVISDGYFIAEAGLLYRKWAGQSTAQDAHTSPQEHQARMSLISARADALLAVGTARLGTERGYGDRGDGAGRA
jgi:glycosyltransferase involved in cell wall biosynthesis